MSMPQVSLLKGPRCSLFLRCQTPFHSKLLSQWVASAVSVFDYKIPRAIISPILRFGVGSSAFVGPWLVFTTAQRNTCSVRRGKRAAAALHDITNFGTLSPQTYSARALTSQTGVFGPGQRFAVHEVASTGVARASNTTFASSNGIARQLPRGFTSASLVLGG